MKKLILASILLATSSLANADVIEADGVSWEKADYAGGFFTTFDFQQWFTDSSAFGIGSEGQAIITADTPLSVGILAGVGEFSSDFSVCSGCELTFAFGGLFPEVVDGSTITFNTDNAWLNIYYDTTEDFDGRSFTAHSNFANAQDGTLWASLGFDSFVLNSIGSTGGFSNATLHVNPKDPATDADTALNFQEGRSDILLLGSAFFNGQYTRSANGQATNIPEPSTIAIFALGLLGLGSMARRRKA